MLLIPNALQAALVGSSLRFATCWRIERTDGVIMRFTDHDTTLVVDGETFNPAGGFNASARQRTSGLTPHNLEVVGVLTSDDITHDDLRAGRYREAKITEFLVEWKYPWAGVFFENVYWLTGLTFSEGVWEAQVQGLSKFLGQNVGDVYGRTCPHKLGDGKCQFDLVAATVTGVAVTTASTDRRNFRATSLIGDGTDYYTSGYITATSGDNDGFIGEIKSFNTSTGDVELYLPMPYQMALGVTFSIAPGCDKLAFTCRTKFNNIVNFRGYSFIPGNDRYVKVPPAK